MIDELLKWRLEDFCVGFWTAVIVSAIAAWPVYRILLALKSRQTVSQYAPEAHQLKQGTPTMGGLIVVAGLVAAFVVGGITAGGRGQSIPGLWAVAAIAIGYAAIGFADDFLVPRLFPGKRGLGWKQKILPQAALALLALPATGLPLTLFNCFVAVIVVLFYANAYNFADGLDGLAGTVGIGLFTGMAGVSLLANAGEPTALVSGAVIAALVPFLFLNAPPAKIFMGDVGSLPIGALGGLCFIDLIRSRNFDEGFMLHGQRFATSEVVQVPFEFVLIALLILSLLMAVELVPVPLQIASVKLRKKRLFPYTPIHHAFEKAGWAETKVVFWFALTQLLLTVCAMTTIYLQAGRDVIGGR